MNSIANKGLTTEEKAGQMMFVGLPGPELDAEAEGILTTVKPGGVCLFTRNIKTAEQTRELLDGIRELLPCEPFLSLDQEGGLVDRLRRVITPMPAASLIGTAQEARDLGEIIGETIRLLGFNMDFAPVVDVLTGARGQSNNGLNSRIFGDSKEGVVELAQAFLNGLEENGILGCLKHFPGLAAATIDAHEELPTIDVLDEELQETDLYPYRELLRDNSGLSVMIAHAAFPNSRLQERDTNGKLLPSSLSRTFVTDLLRGELGFAGVAITDDMEMGAIVKNYGIGDACKMAVIAGQDMLAICANPESIYKGHETVIKAIDSGEIAESRVDESLERIATLRTKLMPPVAMDLHRLSELSTAVKDLAKRLS